MLKKLKYFAVGVTDMGDAIRMYETFFGLKQMMPVEKVERFGFNRTMMGSGEEAWIEIMEPYDPNCNLARFMRDNVGPGNPSGQGFYLVVFETDSIAEDAERIRANGGRVITDGDPIRVAWVHPLDTRNIFIELQPTSSS